MDGSLCSVGLGSDAQIAGTVRSSKRRRETSGAVLIVGWW